MNIYGPPTIGPTVFGTVLQAVSSPVLKERPAQDYYTLCVRYGVDPAFGLGWGMAEHRMGTDPKAVVVRYGIRNWGDCRSRRKPTLGGKLIATDRGNFWAYDSWYASLDDALYRITDPAYNYQQAGVRTVAQMAPIAAPPGDFDNRPELWAANVTNYMQVWQAQNKAGAKGAKVAPIIAISAGHHNTDGGDAFEVQQTGPLAKAVGDACKALGMGVVYLTGNEGMAMEPIGLQGVARKLNGINPRPAIYLETHTEGGGGTGVFAIYPDAPGDVDTDVRDTLGPAVARKIAAATGLGIGGYGKGVISEKQTGVGGQGFRLGIFAATAPSAADVTRLIIEYGAHDKEPDLTIVKQPGFYAKAGKATAQAFAEFLGWQATGGNVVKEAIKEEPTVPPGFLRMGQPDSFDWQGEGVITYRKVRYFNPYTGEWFEREWDKDSGFTPWDKVA